MNHVRFGNKTALILILLAAPTLAQQNRSNASKRKTTFMGLWSIKGMVDQACTNLSRRYNLNEQQEAYTRALMANRVQGFIDQHGAEFEGVMAEIMRTGADPKKPPSPDVIKRWGQRAGPLFEQAKKAILDGNAEWREILDKDQIKIHDADLAQMDFTFKTMNKQFTRWKNGQFKPGETPFPGLTANPAVAGRGGRQPVGRPQNPINTSEHFWKIWVLRFIKDYNLDKAQMATAMSILKEHQQQGAAYRQSKEADMTLARLAIQKAAGARDREAQKKASDKLREINKPIDELFTKLKNRLNGIPTESQRAQYEARQKDMLSRVNRARKVTTTKPAGKPTAKPATPVKPTSAKPTPAKPTPAKKDKKVDKIEIK